MAAGQVDGTGPIARRYDMKVKAGNLDWRGHFVKLKWNQAFTW